MSRPLRSPETQVLTFVPVADQKEPTFSCFLVISLIYAQSKSCCWFLIPAPLVESSDLVTMMYSLSTYKLFLSQYYLLLPFNKILKLIFHCRSEAELLCFPVSCCVKGKSLLTVDIFNCFHQLMLHESQINFGLLIICFWGLQRFNF